MYLVSLYNITDPVSIFIHPIFSYVYNIPDQFLIREHLAQSQIKYPQKLNVEQKSPTENTQRSKSKYFSLKSKEQTRYDFPKQNSWPIRLFDHYSKFHILILNIF